MGERERGRAGEGASERDPSTRIVIDFKREPRLRPHSHDYDGVLLIFREFQRYAPPCAMVPHGVRRLIGIRRGSLDSIERILQLDFPSDISRAKRGPRIADLSPAFYPLDSANEWILFPFVFSLSLPLILQ